jgi:rubrerythrin
MSVEYEAELYVHAIAIEREAAERYAELAARMDREGSFAVAALFRMLAKLEARHLDELQRRAAGIELPPLTSDYSWRDGEAPETVARDLVVRGMTQRRALEIALEAENRARAFFEHAARICGDPAVRALAQEMAAEEAEHAALIGRMLERGARCEPDWRSVTN